MVTSMKKIYYWNDEKNFGDQLNHTLVSKMLNCPLKWSKASEADFLCIGSLLGVLIKKHGIIELVKRLFFPIRIIGIGSIDGIHSLSYQFIPCCNWIAVRGNLTKNLLSERFNQNMTNCKVGDLGLLVSDYYKREDEKKYDYGIILHHSQDYSNLKSKNNLIQNEKSILLIDVSNDVDFVIDQILSCKCILSSSLHGLIVADSFGIPNKWMNLSGSDLLEKQNFKFLAYYSSMDIYDEKPLNSYDIVLSEPFSRSIIDNFSKRIEKIEIVKQSLRNCLENYKSTKSYGLSFIEYVNNIIFCVKYSVKHLNINNIFLKTSKKEKDA